MKPLDADCERHPSNKLCVILAKGGAKGVLGKNSRALGGEFLIECVKRRVQCF